MKHSIRFKLSVLLAALIAFTIFIPWFINRTFLSDYYLHCKVDKLEDVFYKVQDIYANSKEEIFLSEEDTLTMEKLSSSSDVNIYVLMSFAGAPVSSYPHPNDLGDREQYQIQSLIRDYMSRNANSKNRTVIEECENYVIYRLYDSRLDANYIDLIGLVDGNKVVFLRSNFESIQESVNLSNQFLGYVGLIAVIIGIIAMFIISSRFTKPILDLSNIAKRMADLDFEAKYPINRKDEIAELGASINILSDKLQKTISELKKANNELKNDIQKKIEIDEMRKEFLSNVSHELKTPISLIQGYAEGLMENDNEDEENRNFYCEVIIDEAMAGNLLALNVAEREAEYLSCIITTIVQVLDVPAVVIFGDLTYKFELIQNLIREKVNSRILSRSLGGVEIKASRLTDAPAILASGNLIIENYIRAGDT